jgi:hypothetical protein
MLPGLRQIGVDFLANAGDPDRYRYCLLPPRKRAEPAAPLAPAPPEDPGIHSGVTTAVDQGGAGRYATAFG